jgi:purine catabolism regulator
MVDHLPELTIRDIIRRPLFQGSIYIASEKALDRVVRWAHVMEVTEVGQLLSGYELILSTGIGWHDNEETSTFFLQQLIDNNASALCIELGTYTKQPMERMNQLALKADFPLIFFNHKVRYIDIIRDLHTYFINQNQQMNEELDRFSRKLDELSFSGKGLMALFKLLHQTTKSQIFYLPNDGSEPLYYPVAKEESIWNLIKGLRAARTQSEGVPVSSAGAYACCSINLMGQQFAELALHNMEGVGVFEQLALDRCVIAVSHELMRTKYNEEKRRDMGWLHEWLGGVFNIHDITVRLSAMGAFQPDSPKVVCVMEPQLSLLHSKEFESMLIHRNIAVRQLFEQEGYCLIPVFADNQIIYIILSRNKKRTQDIVASVMNIINKLHVWDAHNQMPIFSQIKGIGTVFYRLEHMYKSYNNARKTIAIQKESSVVSSPLYQDLHIYKFIHSLYKQNDHQDFYKEYLEQILDYDHKHNGHLFVTLKTFLKLSGSKQNASKELFIVRQTLYHRIDKIKQFLGDDFMQPHKRIAIELAIYAYEYAQNKT